MLLSRCHRLRYDALSLNPFNAAVLRRKLSSTGGRVARRLGPRCDPATLNTLDRSPSSLQSLHRHGPVHYRFGSCQVEKQRGSRCNAAVTLRWSDVRKLHSFTQISPYSSNNRVSGAASDPTESSPVRITRWRAARPESGVPRISRRPVDRWRRSLEYHIARKKVDKQRRRDRAVQQPFESAWASTLHFLSEFTLPVETAAAPTNQLASPPETAFEASKESEQIAEGSELTSQSGQSRRSLEHVPIVQWTAADFTAQVFRLTNLKFPYLLRPPHYSKTGGQVRIVTKELVDLFDHPDAHRIISLDAFSLAIKYLLYHQETPMARRFLEKMAWFELVPDVKIYNRFLRSCSASQDIFAFQTVLRKMAVSQIRPDYKSWVAFLFLARTNAQKAAVFYQMEKLNLYQDNAHAKAGIVRAIMPIFGPYLSAGGQCARFISMLDSILGQQWFDRHNANALIWELGKHGNIIEAVEVVMNTVGQERGFRPDTESLTNLLYHCANSKRYSEACWLVKYLKQKWNVLPNGKAYQYLFKMGWVTRLPNLSRAVWWYACLSGHATHNMKQRILDVLEGKASSVAIRTRQFRKSFLVTGLGITQSISYPPEPYFQRIFPTILSQDLKAHREWEPLLDFDRALISSLAKDMKWKTERIQQRKGLSWRAMHAVRIPIRRRPSGQISLSQLSRRRQIKRRWCSPKSRRSKPPRSRAKWDFSFIRARKRPFDRGYLRRMRKMPTPLVSY